MSRFPRREYERVLRAIESLAEDPKPSGARKMRGTGNLGDWRIRVGRDYRVIYRIDDDAREVLILEAGPRRRVEKRSEKGCKPCSDREYGRFTKGEMDKSPSGAARRTTLHTHPRLLGQFGK
jgi:mRNA interferase RelE/StbE